MCFSCFSCLVSSVFFLRCCYMNYSSTWCFDLLQTPNTFTVWIFHNPHSTGMFIFFFFFLSSSPSSHFFLIQQQTDSSTKFSIHPFIHPTSHWSTPSRCMMMSFAGNACTGSDTAKGGPSVCAIILTAESCTYRAPTVGERFQPAPDFSGTPLVNYCYSTTHVYTCNSGKMFCINNARA